MKVFEVFSVVVVFGFQQQVEKLILKFYYGNQSFIGHLVFKISQVLSVFDSLLLLPSDSYLPTTPDLAALRDVTINETLRSTTNSNTVGKISLSIYTLLTKDFKKYGVNI